MEITTFTEKMIYGYIRVSSDKQTVENQRFEINKFCEHEKLHVDDWIEETISGTKNYDKRQSIAERDAKREMERAMREKNR